MKKLLLSVFGFALVSSYCSPYAYSQSDDSDSDVDYVCLDNPASLESVNGYCTLTPEKYEVKIYEMGLCPTNPLSGTTFSKDDCVTTLLNSSPIAANMANGSSIILKCQNQRDCPKPKPGEYGYAYIVIEDDFKLKFSYKLNNTTYYSNGKNSSAANPVKNAKTSPPAVDFIETLNDFGDSEEGFSATATALVDNGTGSITALLTDSNLKAATSSASVTRLVGVYLPKSKVKITDDTIGLEVQFVVTDQGGGLQSCVSDNGEDGQVREDEEQRIQDEEEREIAESGDDPDVIARIDQARSLREQERETQDLEQMSQLSQVCIFGSGPFSAKFKPF